MNRKLLLTLIFIFTCVIYTHSQLSQTIHVNQAGSLNTLLGSNKTKVTNLILTGVINDSDFLTIKQMEALQSLDMSNVDINNGVIPSEAFANSTINNLILPTSLKSIGDRAFKNTILSSLDFKACSDLQELGIEVFSGTVLENKILDFSTKEKLTTFNYKTLNGTHLGSFSSFEGSVILPNNLKVIPEATFSCFSGSIKIPDSVEDINPFAFSQAKLEKGLVLPKSLKKIGYKVFALTTIPSLNFSICPDLEELGQEVFFNTILKSNFLDFSTNNKLTTFISSIWNDYHLGTFSNFKGNVTLPNNLKTIQEATFSCFRGSIEIPDSVEEIDLFAFSYAILEKNLILPKSLKRIGYKAFAQTKIPSLDFSLCSALEELDHEVFYYISLKNNTIDLSTNNNLTIFKSSAWNNYFLGTFTNFYGHVILPEHLETIPPMTFANFSGSVDLSLNLKTIGANAFCYSDIVKINFPKSLTYIDDKAFFNCSNLTKITSNNPTPPSLGSSVFEGVETPKCKLFVTSKGLPLYEAADQWKDFTISTMESTFQKNTSVKNYIIQEETNVSIYPNPTTDVLNINGDNIEDVRVYNTSGKLVKSGGNSNSINIQDLSSGIYIIKIKTPNGTQTEKVMKK